MSIALNDLQPKPIEVKVKGVELTSKPLRLKHALILAKIGSVFENASKATVAEIEKAQTDVDAVFTELIPELKGIDLDMSSTMELLTQLMERIEPEENEQLKESGVKIDTDPKVQGTG